MLQKTFKCKTDLEKSVILETFEERNWTICQPDGKYLIKIDRGLEYLLGSSRTSA